MNLTDLNPISSAITTGVSSLANSVGDLVDRFKLTPDEKIAAKKEWQQLIDQHELALLEVSSTQERIAMEDRDSARKMQITALQQSGWLAKNFVYLLSIVTIVGAFAFAVALFFVTVPEKNTRLIEMFADLFLFAGGAAVYNFFLGSSAGSKQKTDIMAASKSQKSPSGDLGVDDTAKPSDIDELLLSRRDKKQRRKLTE